jgi:predicted glutamine amidotransferase
MSCNSSATINFSFTGFAERGGRTDDHADGWGIAFYEHSGCRTFHDDQAASTSPLAAFIRTYPIKSKIVVAHIRKATQGAISLSNCHPFQREWLGQTWIFAHNGDLRAWRPTLNGAYLPVGSTDSEYAFCWMLQELRARFPQRLRPPAWPELAPHIASLCAEVARHGNFNMTLSNGEALYAHCSTHLYTLERTYPFPVATLVDCDVTLDLSALNAPNDRITLVATEPLTSAEPWTKLDTGGVRVYVDGAAVWAHVNANTPQFEVACGLSEQEAVLA